MTDLNKRLFAGLLALVLLCAPLSGCAAREAERYDVLASTAPVRAMTAALLEGTGLNCGLVVTESVSCLHDYTLTVAQMEKIGQADAVVLNGLGLEEFMEDALRTAKRTITASTGVDTLPGEDGEDPHIWLDPANCILMCKNIAAGLAEFYPDKQPLIEQNLSAVTAEYEAAQTYGEETLKALSCRELVKPSPPSSARKTANGRRLRLSRGRPEPACLRLQWEWTAARQAARTRSITTSTPSGRRFHDPTSAPARRRL